MKKIIPIVIFLGFINIMMWIGGESSKQLSLNRVFVAISSVLVPIMIVLTEYKIKKMKERRKKDGD